MPNLKGMRRFRVRASILPKNSWEITTERPLPSRDPPISGGKDFSGIDETPSKRTTRQRASPTHSYHLLPFIDDRVKEISVA